MHIAEPSTYMQMVRNVLNGGNRISWCYLEDCRRLGTPRLHPAIRGDETIAQVSLSSILEGVERDEITAALQAAAGDTVAAAARLQISRPTLYRRLRSLGIQIPS